jgi:eukaryotic-like serine/threonine-protein kinase
MGNAAAALSPSELVLGRYRPLHPLGSGGSGSVWLARDEPTGVKVALKIVPREGKAASRAEREVAAAARLRHKRCLRAFALAHDEGHVYIASEYVGGRTLRQAMRAGELDDRSALEASAQICDGLAHAHARGIVHRDVKPANVLLAARAAQRPARASGPVEGVHHIDVRLLDFGLAQLTEAETLTAVGDVPGTLAYISPERLAGEDATPAADVWAVGVLLWEALAGEHPFWSGSLLETAQLIERGAPSLAEVRPDLPRAVIAAVDGALTAAPRRRPSAAKFAAALREAAARRRRPKQRPRPPELDELAPRLGHAALAALTAGWSAAALPFYPVGWVPVLAALAGLLAFARPRAGLALTLAVPVLPLGNVSLGLALLYVLLAATWLGLFSRRPREGLLLVLGPLLAPLGGLGLLPFALRPVRSIARRAVHAAFAVLVAGLVAGLGQRGLPFTGATPPRTLGIDGAAAPGAAAAALREALLAQPALLLEALALGAAAALLPYAARRGLWGIAAFGAAMLAVTLLPVPAAHAPALVACVWLTCLALAAPPPPELRRRLAAFQRRAQPARTGLERA